MNKIPVVVSVLQAFQFELCFGQYYTYTISYLHLFMFIFNYAKNSKSLSYVLLQQYLSTSEKATNYNRWDINIQELNGYSKSDCKKIECFIENSNFLSDTNSFNCCNSAIMLILWKLFMKPTFITKLFMAYI